ncbi:MULTISPECIES: cellulose synthase family protein [Croceibacter]|uniref:cellulose synthase family protein n=1 Tax=Croceibacter TaxID=216431 RepID=UPI000C3F128E|nr:MULTISPECIES: cellulose synthase family protein [Croceibacter]MBG24617.1 glycosyl transferase family 2 [Croceibacter sp.]|tara:strand:- start:4356 stop:5828 length:1473 start_codon:yes stop_codon:yes gene_type:complete
MDLFIIIIYTLALLLIFFYSLAQLNLYFNYLKAKKSKQDCETFNLNNPHEVPYVTIQLPLYNEKYVVERLLNNIATIEYPKDRLEIQVLDDSTDESVLQTKDQIEELRANGLDIIHITRVNRKGFKAGALKEGLKIAKGEFIAIFDADFLPKPNWLLKTIPYFKDEQIGVVQTRWGHINRNYSMLTKVQAFALDFHFILEQVGRNFGNHFINFNGTAGVWRKSCILDAGDWQGDTLTEDLDLSYRAQLKDWKFKYLEDVETPAELPVVISAARSQQFRWNKGAAENFQKLYWRLFTDKTVSAKTKFHSFFHLLNSSMFLLVLLVAILSVPVLFIKNNNPDFSWYFNVIAFFGLSTLIFFISYWLTYKKIHGGGFKNFISFIAMFFTFFSVAMGFSVHNSVAVIEGHLGKKSEFVRTPKFNINSIKDSWKGNKYLSQNVSGNTIIELVLMLYFGYAIYSAFTTGDFGLIIFHLMLFAGFGFVGLKSLFAKG